ncbi:Putative ribokinase (fragment) [Lactobacillus delbrueckii subsp. bulgaricus]
MKINVLGTAFMDVVFQTPESRLVAMVVI